MSARWTQAQPPPPAPKSALARLRPLGSTQGAILRRSDGQHAAVPQPAGEVGRAAVRPAAVAPGARRGQRRVAVAAVVVDQQVGPARGPVVPVRRRALGLRADEGAAAAGPRPRAVEPGRRVLHEDVLERLVLEEAEVGVLVAAAVGQDVEVDYVGWCVVDVGCWRAKGPEVARICLSWSVHARR